ncbi:SRPBCC family protein [Actinoplanes sp. NPDC049265]|uniref:SRPBCC family protein n=1 Tax=Actinoplanes sp. NPDC049265 TaxID=3363902 RepID=UPI003719D1CF
MSQLTLVHEFTVAAPPGEVGAHLCDPELYVGLNPYVVAVRDIRESDGVTEFTAVERLRLAGPLRMDNPIAVRLWPEETGEGARVVFDIRSRGGVQVHIVTGLVAAGPGTAVTDTLTVRVPALLRRTVRTTARAGQLSRAAELANRLSRPAA